MLYGYPGSGKTYFARQFAETFNAAHLHDDRIRSELFETPNYSQEENHIVSSLMNYMLVEFLKAGVSVVYDARSLRTAQRRALRNLANRLHAETMLVWFQIDEESAFTRASKRDRRKIDDRYSPSLDRAAFEQQLQAMQHPDTTEQYLVVSGKHVFSSQKSALLRRLHELGLVDASTANSQVIKPGLVNLIPNPMAGRVDMSRRNIRIH